MTRHFAVVDEATGRIDRTLTIDDVMVDQLFGQAASGQILYETDGSVTGSTHYFSGGALQTFPPQPSSADTWDWQTQQWADPRSLADVKTAATEGIDAERERRTNLPIAYAGAEFDADGSAQRNVSVWQTQLACGLALPDGFVWRDSANTDHPADAAFINGLGAAMTLRGTALYQQAWALKEQVEAATTTQDVEAVQWPA